MIFQSATSPAIFEKLQNYKWLSRPAGWTPPKTKYAESVRIGRGTKRNEEIGNPEQLFFPSVRLSVEFIF
jgi:hypothetical protein